MSTIVALDPGFGNTKVAAEGGVHVLQSAVARPREIGMAAKGLETQARPQTVTLGSGLSFVAGAGAWAWGEPLSTLDFNDLTSPQRLALFYAAVSHLLPPGEHVIDLLVIGLPMPLLQDELQAKAVMAGLGQYKTVHEFTVDGQKYSGKNKAEWERK